MKDDFLSFVIGANAEKETTEAGDAATTTKHLAGKHDQDTHGRRSGADGDPEYWRMTRSEFKYSQNKPKFDAIQAALQKGPVVVPVNQYKSIRLTKPDQVRITPKGSVQIPSGRKWVFLTDDQVNSMAHQSGFKLPKLGEGLYHHVIIREAIAAGKPVPANVLAEYPDING